MKFVFVISVILATLGLLGFFFFGFWAAWQPGVSSEQVYSSILSIAVVVIFGGIAVCTLDT